MSRRQSKPEKSKTSFQIIVISAIVTVITLAITLSISISSLNAKHKYQDASAEYTDLVDQYNHLKPNVSDLVSGKFDLQGHEEKLSSNYSVLTKALFGDARSVSAISEYENQYVKYFGTKGYKNLRQIAFKSDDQLLASRNTETKVMFSDFDLQNKQIKVVVYSQFNVKPNVSNDKYGVVYITVTYDFNKGRAIKTTVQNATFGNDD